MTHPDVHGGARPAVEPDENETFNAAFSFHFPAAASNGRRGFVTEPMDDDPGIAAVDRFFPPAA
jgi:hypothetical protein